MWNFCFKSTKHIAVSRSKLEIPLMTKKVDIFKLWFLHSHISPINYSNSICYNFVQEVKIKASTGNSINVSTRLFALSSLAPKITHLSLLGLVGLEPQDYDVFGTMVHLQLLELGECESVPGKGWLSKFLFHSGNLYKICLYLT